MDKLINNVKECFARVKELESDHKAQADALRDDLQAGYNREYDLEEKLLKANQKIMSLVADNARLEQKLKLRSLN